MAKPVRRRIWIVGLVLILAALLPATLARAHEGDWVANYCQVGPFAFVCGFRWVPHPHPTPEREAFCWAQYELCREFCQLQNPGTSTTARRLRAECYQDCTLRLGQCLRGG